MEIVVGDGRAESVVEEAVITPPAQQMMFAT